MHTEKKWKAALFDFDGVVMDTESQYSLFWGEQGRIYHPEIPRFDTLIKGQTLVQIYDKYFKDKPEVQQELTEKLNEFESSMNYTYIKGVEKFLETLREEGIRCALVTSSNAQKMQAVYRSHPELKDWFKEIITAERFHRSKPDPECFLLGASLCGVKPSECIVFEDSFHGLAAGVAARMKVVALATTNPREALQGKANLIVDDFSQMEVKILYDLLAK